MRVAWQFPSLTVWSQSTVFIHTSTAGVLDSHKDLNQQKMGIPPEYDIGNSVPRQSQEGRDLLKSKKEGDCGFWLNFLWFLEEFFFHLMRNTSTEKNTNISFINTVKWHSLEMALSHIWLMKNICFFMHIYFRIATSKQNKLSNCLAYSTNLVSNALAYVIY